MFDPGSVRTASRNDSGFMLISVLGELAITVAVVGTLIGFMVAATRLVQSASPGTNPLVWSTLTSSAARLEGSLAPPLGCSNPPPPNPLDPNNPPVNSRKDCLTVVADPLRPIPDPAAASRYADEQPVTCWPVTNGEAPLPDQRRLECWQLLDSGYLRIWVHDHAVPDESTLAADDFLPDTSDLLTILNWQPSPNPALSRTATHGLTAAEWHCLTTVELAARQVARQADQSDPPVPANTCSRSEADMPQVAAVELVVCAAIKPKQRNVMKPGFVPFCDGTTGVVLSDGSYRGLDDPNARVDPDDWGTIEGYPLPAISLDIGGS